MAARIHLARRAPRVSSIRAHAASLGCALALGILAPPIRAAPPSAAASAKTPEEIERALEKEKAAQAQLSAKETSILGRLADLERQVELEGRSLRAAQAKVKVSQTRLGGAEANEQVAQAGVGQAMAALGLRLTARYQMGREGYVRFLLGARSINDLLRRKHLYSALLQNDLDALAVLRSKAAQATVAKGALQAARDEVAQSAAAEQEKRSALEQKAALQKRALTQVQQEKGAHEQVVRELEQASRALAERVRVIDEARRAGKPLPVEEPARPASTSTSTSTNPSTSTGTNPSTSTGTSTNPTTGANMSTNPAAEPPGKRVAIASPPIRSQRGKLLFPVATGRVEVRFGRTIDPRFGTVTLQRGLDIRSPEGAEVHAIYAGTVVHAGWFSGYGNLVILDHGDGLFSLFAHLGALTHAVGDVVDRGDVLGSVGDTGSLKGPYLYFELRDGQKPVDPERWLSRNRKAVAGKK